MVHERKYRQSPPIMGDFSSIPGEVLGLIFEHICKNPFLDDLSFEELWKEWRSIVGVSKEWKTVAVEKLRHLLPRAISLTLQDDEVSLPELRGKLCLGSNNGWLLIADISKDRRQMFLLNPLSKHQLPLPPPPCRLRCKRRLLFTVKFKSTTDYQVAICRDRMNPPFFSQIFVCKTGDAKWTILKAMWPHAEDVAFYNQKLYVIYDLEEFHVFSEINGTCKDKLYFRSTVFDEGEYPEGRSYLVETPQKELLKIIRYTKMKFRGGNGKTIDFQVFKVDDKSIDEDWLDEEENGDKVWDKVEDLGDNVVFLGVNSLCLLAQDVPGCTGNSIYFTDYQDTKEDRGVFRMEDREIKPLFQDRPFKPAPMLWFTPDLNS
ncbi:hypothetical protein ACHQM5_018681 [Ranunculus cassubicifolius]